MLVTKTEKSDEYSAQSQDSARTVLYPDLHILTNGELWTVTPEKHKYAAAARSFCFATTEEGEKAGCVQRSLCLEEVTDDSSSTRVELPNGVNIVWPPVEKPQEQEPNCGLVHGKKRQPRKYEDTTSSLLKQNTSSGNPWIS